MEFVEKRKKKHGDRNDGHLIKNIPVINKMMVSLYPNRCDNEVSSTQEIDVTNLLKFIDKINKENLDKKLKFFHCFIAAIVRVFNERRKLLRFVVKDRFYEKDEIKISFIAKRGFSDKAEEAVVTYLPKGKHNVFDVSNFILNQVKDARDPIKIEEEKKNKSSMESLERLPRFAFRFVCAFLRWSYRHGCTPKSAMDEDPSFSTVMLSNLGSIKSESVYHHLNNYGNCSMMITIGVIKKKKVLMEDGREEIRDIVDITGIFDERIADGFYFIKSLELLKKYLSHPESLLNKFNEEIKFDN